MVFDLQSVSLFPSKPGVYLMKGKGGQVLYVGKAKDLKSRLRQYLTGQDLRPQIPFLLEKVDQVETILVLSEKEALLLESNLIKRHKPPYNILLKDDKSFIALRVNIAHPWPSVSLIRVKNEPHRKDLLFGPYTSAFAARKMVDQIHQLFQLRQCSDQELLRRKRPCILHEMKRCMAPCVEKCTKDQYDNEVKKAVRFIKGYNQQVVEKLWQEMEEASEDLDFEKAQEIFSTIQAIEKNQEKQHVHFSKQEDVDVWGLYREGESGVLTRLRFEQGELAGASHYPFEHVLAEDEEIFEAALVQFYSTYSPPDTILMEESVSDALKELVPAKWISPKIGDKKVLIQMALQNAEAAYLQKRDQKAEKEKILIRLQELFRLQNYPYLIACIDTAHLAGSDPTASIITFRGGEADKKGYRSYKIRTTQAGDDFQAMREVLDRKFSKEGELPDLLILDGGKGQLSIAKEVLSNWNIITVDLIALVKEEGRHDRGMTQEGVFLLGEKDAIRLDRHSSVLHFLQRIRDEAHRFAQKLHLGSRSKRMTKSALDSIPGIGPKRKKALLTHFGSFQRIIEATDQELLSIKGVTQKIVDDLRRWVAERKG